MRDKAATDAARYLASHPLFLCSQYIACYSAYDGEINAIPIMQAIWQAKKQCYLPVLTEGKMLEFVRYEEGDILLPNQFSILEPQNSARKLSPEKLDLVLSPLVAFDKQGHRLGTGGGYYDRTFAFKNGEPQRLPNILGLGYAMQQVESLPVDPWDILLTGVVTEQGVMMID